MRLDFAVLDEECDKNTFGLLFCTTADSVDESSLRWLSLSSDLE